MQKMSIILCMEFFCLPVALFGQWEIVQSFEDCTLTSVYFKNDSTGFITGIFQNDARIYLTEDFGNSWSMVYDEYGTYLYDVCFPTENVGYASAGFNVLKTTDGGHSWSYLDPDATGNQFKSLAFEDENVGFGCFADGGSTFAKTTDGGYSWEHVDGLGGRKLERIGECQYAMLSGHFRLTDDCWENYQGELIDFDDRSSSDFSINNDGTVITCGIGFVQENWTNYGFIGSSHDLGENWDILSLPQFSQLKAVEFASSQTVYCVGLPGTPDAYSILKSPDAGNTWFYQEYELPCPDCTGPDLRDLSCPSEDVCYAIRSTGTVYRTTNGGGELLALDVIEHSPDISIVTLYPNPGHGICHIASSQNLSRVVIYNSQGQQIRTFNFNSNRALIDVSLLESGIYHFEIELHSGQKSNKRFIRY